MLLALPCFARSSPKLEAWLLNHPRFGPGLRAWRSERAVPRNAKIMACIGMCIGYFVFLLHAQPNWILSAAIGLFTLLWAVWIVRRPDPRTRRRPGGTTPPATTRPPFRPPTHSATTPYPTPTHSLPPAPPRTPPTHPPPPPPHRPPP